MLSPVPEYITIEAVILVLCVTIGASVLTGYVVAGFEVDWKDVGSRGARNAVFLLGFSFPVALIAYVAGYLSTLGRASAIAQLLPAILTLMGAVCLYVFGAENKYRFTISYSICIFVIMLLYGTQYGAYKRDADQESRLNKLVAIELRLKTIRRNLGIGDDFPAWITGAEPK